MKLVASSRVANTCKTYKFNLIGIGLLNACLDKKTPSSEMLCYNDKYTDYEKVFENIHLLLANNTVLWGDVDKVETILFTLFSFFIAKYFKSKERKYFQNEDSEYRSE